MMTGTIRIATIPVLLVSMLTLGACDKPAPKPGNYVVVMIDRSISFHSRQEDAINKTVKYLEQIANRTIGRWQGQADKIAVIAIDAIPAVLWEGNLQELKKISKEDWTNRFAARTDFERCTDITSAFTLAAERFANADAQSTSKYLLVFSDLIHEPPISSVSRCAKPHPAPADDFPWASLEDVSVSVFWLPINQKLIWQRAVQEKGLAGHVSLYSDSESGTVTITAPPKAKRKVSERERAQDAGEYGSLLRSVVVVAIAGAALLAVFVLVFCVIAHTRRSAVARKPAMPRRRPLSPEQLRARGAAPPQRRE
jgi:hypothetical protein